MELNCQVAEKNFKQEGCMQLVDSNNAAKAYSTDLVELAKEVQKADEYVHANVANKMQMIVDQIRFLQGQAEKILGEAKLNTELHHIACNCKKVPGSMYYVYQRPTDKKFISMISPEEWGGSCPNQFLGAYRLEPDLSWTPAEQLKTRAADQELIGRILGNQKLLSLESSAEVGAETRHM